MTPRRIVGATAAILLSGGAHLVGSGWFTPNRIELEGGGEPIPARLGNSFADMVAGMPGSERPDVTDPVEVEADTVAPNQAEPTAPNEVDPADAEVADARDSEQPLVDAPAISATPSTIAAIPASPVETAPVEPTTSAATAVVETARPETSQAVAETDAQILTPLSSPRPSVRPDGLAPPPPPPQSVQPQVAAPQPQPQPPAVTGGGSTNTTRGSASGTETGAANATAPAPQQPTPQPGNAAAVANYPGQVMQQISRQGRPRLRHNGPDAVVAFRVASNGELAGVSLARSSGNPELDQAGLAIVQRSAPFPPPPSGAQTSFSVAFGGR
ncbi:TonB family protein [Roseobacter sp. HKCCD9010]|uniref:energy transducer TonB n=1 Tax=unclassified Roseobacter TaxID=196798 RepID=UPI001492CB7D|nr:MULTISPECIES: energy transducer TonB [unclassified Roseobacter]MBF9052456.1 TonB family protein [Rhodobacterales bacterium HKCCD4356]NNV14237.1 TonB family protein [Roseobacter sp. HKCCD7357]NNV18648.1 TonB family protein [Roseobacter sp. HKCCD8768]NNV28100.1 TonB family protein [Roseobacter sp. HKCCD8192]NNV32382.1 TonB family protein [Roseobacter sp. HKCCD9061]